MLRQTLQSAALLQSSRRSSWSIRKYAAAAAATSAKKRKLQKMQSAAAAATGSDQAAAAAAAAGTASKTATASSSTPPSTPASSAGNETSTMIPIAIVGLAAAGGAAWYLDLLNLAQEGEDVGVIEQEVLPEEKSSAAVVNSVVTPESTATEEASDGSSTTSADATDAAKETTTVAAAATESKSVSTTMDGSNSGGSRVTTVQVPSRPSAAPAEKVPPPQPHPVRGNRVSMAPPARPNKEPSAVEAARELEQTSFQEASDTLVKARRTLQANVDQEWLHNLDEATPEELKIRLVQLATELQDRTKWEAVRLKEFMAMKEKETGEKYMDILQKQRLEYESLLAARLREQESVLTRQANAALQQKEDSIQAVVKANADAQEAEHKADLESTEQRLNAELDAKYQTTYSDKLAEEKSRYVADLEDKLTTIEQLAAKLKEMESALEEFKSFEIGSVNAHRLSAAALAFSEKLETDKPAGKELEFLKNAAGGNKVIASAISTVPPSVDKGIPTLSELQTRFDTVYKRSRQAALVPAGRVGLGGQLLGMVFATVKYAPEPDDPAPQDGKGENEYLLVRARKLVQLGELERAIEQLEKLDGQPAFTVKDWTLDAKDRVAAEKAAKVIKMECAIVNESMSEQATV